MNYQRFLEDAIDQLHAERRYRVFADLERMVASSRAPSGVPTAALVETCDAPGIPYDAAGRPAVAKTDRIIPLLTATSGAEIKAVEL